MQRLVTAVGYSSCWCAVHRTGSWEWLNTSGSAWTLYWSIDTPLCTEREELKKPFPSASLCLAFSVSNTLLLSAAREEEERKTLLTHKSLLTSNVHMHNAINTFQLLFIFIGRLQQTFRSYLMIAQSIWINLNRNPLLATSTTFPHFNQVQLPNTCTVCAFRVWNIV